MLTLSAWTGSALKNDHQNTPHLCLGHSALPEDLTIAFEKTDDAVLLEKALGSPDKGKLCQGEVYKSNTNAKITLYRAWNSTNPDSKFGQW